MSTQWKKVFQEWTSEGISERICEQIVPVAVPRFRNKLCEVVVCSWSVSFIMTFCRTEAGYPVQGASHLITSHLIPLSPFLGATSDVFSPFWVVPLPFFSFWVVLPFLPPSWVPLSPPLSLFGCLISLSPFGVADVKLRETKGHKDPEKIDLNVPRRAQYLHSAWKKHQDAVFWVDINLAIRKRLTFHQTRSNAIIFQGTLPAYCIPKVERLKTGEVSNEKSYMSPRPPPKISLRHDHDWTRGIVPLGSTVDQQPEGKVVRQSRGEVQHATFSQLT